MGMPKKKGGFNIHAGVFLPSEPVSHYRCMNLPETDDDNRTHQNDANTPS